MTTKKTTKKPSKPAKQYLWTLNDGKLYDMAPVAGKRANVQKVSKSGGDWVQEALKKLPANGLGRIGRPAL